MLTDHPPREDVEDVMDSISRLLPHRSHPDSEWIEREIERKSVDWFDRAHLVEDPERLKRLREAGFGVGVGMAFPSANPEAILFWTRFSLWHAAFDDLHAEQNAARDLPAFFQQAGPLWLMLDQTLPHQPLDGRFAESLQELTTTLDTIAPRTVATRIRQALRDYLFSAAWEATLRATHTEPSEDEYLSLFRYATSFSFHLEFVEVSLRTPLTENQRRDPRIRRIRAAACDMISLANHICSAQVEQEQARLFGPYANRPLVDVAHLCLAQARTVAELRAATTTNRAIGPYCSAIADWCAGTFWWHRKARATRYRPDTGNSQR